MITPEPVVLPRSLSPISFLVNNIDLANITSSYPDGNLDNILYQLQNTAISIEGASFPLKYGDIFTLSGTQAQRVKDLYIDRLPKILEIFYLPNVEGLSADWADGVLSIEWTPSNLYLTSIEVITDTYTIKAFDVGVNQVNWDIDESSQITINVRFVNFDGDHSPDVTTTTIQFAPLARTDNLTMHFDATATVDGTIVSTGGTSLTAYGFVWATHDNPTLDDNVDIIGTEDFTGAFTYTTAGAELPFFGTVYFAAYATNSFGTSYGSVLSGEVMICLREGTLISLANGEIKKIEDITYKDSLLVWNFDDGDFAEAKPVWIVKPFKAKSYAIVKFNNGSELHTIPDGKGHRIFNMGAGKFTHLMNKDTPIKTETFSEDGVLEVVSKETVESETTFYNIITHTHMNMFANRILTSTGLNNLYPIKDMKFIKDNRELRNREEFDGISQDIFDGMRLSEQPKDYPNLKNKMQRLEYAKI